MTAKSYNPKRQNVSINVKVIGYSVDLVPAKHQDSYSNDHSLYCSKAGTWAKTNVAQHIQHVIRGDRRDETRIIKLRRNQKSLDFPTFYLELTVINALSPQYGALSDNVLKVIHYLANSFSNARVVDPANTNNIISDDLTAAEKARIASAAEQALRAPDWNQVVK